VDNVQATGLGLNGPFQFVSGTRGASSTTVPLAQAKLGIPPGAGSLYVSVTDPAGNRTLSQVNTDPSTQSLQDVANAISAVPNLSAQVNTQTGTMSITAAPGFSFDFAGRLASAPTNVSFTDPTPPTATASGTYTGASNDVYTYTIAGVPGPGPATIGVTPNLKLNVTNGAGQAVASLNIGQGYAPGSNLQATNGISVSLTSGNVNNGDHFSTTVVSQPDTAGILTSLGINTFFTGSGAGGIAVQPGLASNPALLAGSRSGQPGDNTNLQRLVAIQQTPLLANGTQTLDQFQAAMVGDIGTQVSQLNQTQNAQQALGQNLQAQQQSVSGVDPNEELVNLLQYQRGFQLASRYINIVNQTLDSLLQMI
jgi:flagellar hook-associated protein 1